MIASWSCPTIIGVWGWVPCSPSQRAGFQDDFLDELAGQLTFKRNSLKYWGVQPSYLRSLLWKAVLLKRNLHQDWACEPHLQVSIAGLLFILIWTTILRRLVDALPLDLLASKEQGYYQLCQ
jgi:hypothetical protein